MGMEVSRSPRDACDNWGNIYVRLGGFSAGEHLALYSRSMGADSPQALLVPLCRKVSSSRQSLGEAQSPRRELRVQGVDRSTSRHVTEQTYSHYYVVGSLQQFNQRKLTLTLQ